LSLSIIAKFKLLRGRTPAFNDFLYDQCSIRFKLFILTGWHGLCILLTMASLKDHGIQTVHCTSISFNLVTGTYTYSLQLN